MIRRALAGQIGSCETNPSDPSRWSGRRRVDRTVGTQWCQETGQEGFQKGRQGRETGKGAKALESDDDTGGNCRPERGQREYRGAVDRGSRCFQGTPVSLYNRPCRRLISSFPWSDDQIEGKEVVDSNESQEIVLDSEWEQQLEWEDEQDNKDLDENEKHGAAAVLGDPLDIWTSKEYLE